MNQDRQAWLAENAAAIIARVAEDLRRVNQGDQAEVMQFDLHDDTDRWAFTVRNRDGGATHFDFGEKLTGEEGYDRLIPDYWQRFR